MPDGLVSGFLSTKNSLQDMQSQQLRDALAIASTISQQHEREYQKQQDVYQKGIQERQVAVQEQNAKTQEEYRKSSEKRQAKDDEQKAIQSAFDKAFQLYNKGIDFPTAFSRAKKLDPEGVAELEQDIHETYRAKKRGEYEQTPAPPPLPPLQPQPLPGMQSVTGPNTAAPVGAPPQPMPMPLGAVGGAMGGFMGGMSPQTPPAGPPVPPVPPTGTMGMQMGPPMGPRLPIPQEKPPFVDPTLGEALHQPSPLWLEEMEKRNAANALAKARTDVLLRGQALKEELDPLKIDARIASDYAKMEEARRKGDREERFVDAKIKDMADKLTVLDRNFREKEKVDESLIKFRESMAVLGGRRAATGEKNAATNAATNAAQHAVNGQKAQAEYRHLEGLAVREGQRATQLDNMALHAKENMETALSEWEQSKATLSVSNKPEDVLAANALLTKAMDYRRRYTQLKIDTQRAKEQAQALAHIAGTMQTQLYGTVLENTGKPPPAAPRMPAKPRSSVDDAAKALGIP